MQFTHPTDQCLIGVAINGNVNQIRKLDILCKFTYGLTFHLKLGSSSCKVCKAFFNGSSCEFVSGKIEQKNTGSGTFIPFKTILSSLPPVKVSPVLVCLSPIAAPISPA